MRNPIPKKYLKGRVCDEAGCTTRLSVYNDKRTCAKCERRAVRLGARREVAGE